MWKWEETAGKKSRWVCIQEGLAPAPGRVDPAAAWDGHPLLHRRVADDVAGLQRAVGVLEVAEEEEPVAGVDDAGVPVGGAGAHLSIVGAQLSIAACGEQSRDS